MEIVRLKYFLENFIVNTVLAIILCIGIFFISICGGMEFYPSVIMDSIYILTVLSFIYAICSAYFLNKQNTRWFVVLSMVSIMLLFFYNSHGDQEWNLENILSFFEVIIALASLAVVTWGGYIAFKQIKESVQVNKISSFKMMVDILQNPKSREDRKIVYGLIEGNKIKSMEMWSEEEKNAAQHVLADFDQVGLMVKYGLLDYDFIKGWLYPLYKSLYILEDYMSDKKKRYVYFLKNDKKGISNYFLGLDWLLSLKDNNVKYDFELTNLNKRDCPKKIKKSNSELKDKLLKRIIKNRKFNHIA